jgi:glycosyltransferase involved in cell wall biosynthesis
LTNDNIENINTNGIYTDLIRELSKHVEKLYVVTPREKRMKKETDFVQINNINLLKVKVGNMTKTNNFIEKGLSQLFLQRHYLKAIKKYFKNIHFDLILYHTPPITFEKVIKKLKKENNSTTYLMLKDIFPQNAVDLDILKENGYLYKFFRKKEKNLYKYSDYIGCMSQKNKEYILNHNKINEEKVEIFPNAVYPSELKQQNINKEEVLNKLKIPKNKSVFLYGGNLGKPQGIDFLNEIISNFYKVKNGYLIIIGSGTEYDKIKNHINNVKPNNVKLFNFIPREEYNKILIISDVGLIFLDKRFTIPNYPQRLLGYMDYEIPIIAATDKVTDIKDTLKESNSGFWCESGDIDCFIEKAKKLANDEELRKKMGKNGKKYLENHFNIEKNIEIILNKLEV